MLIRRNLPWNETHGYRIFGLRVGWWGWLCWLAVGLLALFCTLRMLFMLVAALSLKVLLCFDVVLSSKFRSPLALSYHPLLSIARRLLLVLTFVNVFEQASH